MYTHVYIVVSLSCSLYMYVCAYSYLEKYINFKKAVLASYTLWSVGMSVGELVLG